MPDVPEVAFPSTRRAYRFAPVAGARLRSAGANVATRNRIRSNELMLSEARRAWNRGRLGLASELRCECADPSCRAWVPAVADKHRKDPGEFVVAPVHFDRGLVIRAADVFFVVELRDEATQLPGNAT
jgi:hypothetical protein